MQSSQSQGLMQTNAPTFRGPRNTNPDAVSSIICWARLRWTQACPGIILLQLVLLIPYRFCLQSPAKACFNTLHARTIQSCVILYLLHCPGCWRFSFWNSEIILRFPPLDQSRHRHSPTNLRSFEPLCQMSWAHTKLVWITACNETVKVCPYNHVQNSIEIKTMSDQLVMQCVVSLYCLDHRPSEFHVVQLPLTQSSYFHFSLPKSLSKLFTLSLWLMTAELVTAGLTLLRRT